MNTEKLEPLKAKIIFIRRDKNGNDCGDVLELYNRQSFDDLNIEKVVFDDSQFISLNDKFNFNGIAYKVVDVNFRMFKDMFVRNETETHLLTKEDIMSFNCQIGVFVTEID